MHFSLTHIFFSVLIFTIYGNSVFLLVSVVDCHVASTVLVTMFADVTALFIALRTECSS